MAIENNTIPPMTDSLGKYWKQPDPIKILIDDNYALMEKSTFEELAEYSSTTPSGVYPGKMWRMNWHGKWLLRWFGEHEDPRFCSNHQREILIV